MREPIPAMTLDDQKFMAFESLLGWTAAVVSQARMAIAAASTRRFDGWDIYLAGAAIIVGLAIAMAIALLP